MVIKSPGFAPSEAMSSGCSDATGSGSMESSTPDRRVMLPVCQCSSWRPVINTMGYSASGRWESFGEHDGNAGVAFLLAWVGDAVFCVQPLPGNAGNARHGASHFIEHCRYRRNASAVMPRQSELARHLDDDVEVLS